MAVASAETLKRWDICKACPQFRAPVKWFEHCGLCGCLVRAKILPPGEKCPSGRW